MPARAATVSVQLVNPDEHTLVRVILDRTVIYEGVPKPADLGIASTLPVAIGTYDLDAAGRHVLTADVPSTRTKAQLEWSTRTVSSAWIVIRYYPGAPSEPAFMTFSLQDSSYKLK